MSNRIPAYRLNIIDKLKMTHKPTICILSTPNSKNSVMMDIYYRLQNVGYCIVKQKIIDDKITGVRPDFVIIDDIFK